MENSLTSSSCLGSCSRSHQIGLASLLLWYDLRQSERDVKEAYLSPASRRRLFTKSHAHG